MHGDEHYRRTVREYYDAKTAALLQKYGPGPRVHYHLGLLDERLQPLRDPALVRQRLVESQEAMMRKAADIWDADRILSGRVLDVGCGLGGGSIFWAQEYGACVTAVTVAKEHIPVISKFARQAGVDACVHPLLADACEVATDIRHDAAVAFESTCYFPRAPWFRHLPRLICVGGYVCIEEVFQRRPGGTNLWDRYFHARAGSVQEYVQAAAAAGFELDRDVEDTEQTRGFWRQSVAWIDAVLATTCLDSDERRRLERSRDVHDALYHEWGAGGIEHRLLRFRRCG